MDAITSGMAAIPVMEPGVLVEQAHGQELMMIDDGIGAPEAGAFTGVGDLTGGATMDAVGSGSAAISTTVVKRKRGRPRKSEVAGTGPSPISAPVVSQVAKRGRGRPRGSGRRQLAGDDPVEAVGGKFDVEVLTVQSGEDIVHKIVMFAQRGETVCVVSATGAISSAMLGQAGTSGGPMRYEGIYEILALQVLLSLGGGVAGARRRPNIFSIFLAKPDGRVLSGCIGGPVIAAGPVQLVLGVFKEPVPKELRLGRPCIPPAPTQSFAANTDQPSFNPTCNYNGTGTFGDGSCELPSSAELDSLLGSVDDHTFQNN